MKRKSRNFLSTLSLGLALSFTGSTAMAQNNNSSTGEIKQSGNEAKKAGQSLGQNVKHGRVVRGGKHFGRHAAKSGKHFGRSTKKVIKKAIS